MAVPLTGTIRLRADIAAAFGSVDDGQAPTISGLTNRPTTQYSATASVTSTDLRMGNLLAGWNFWTDYGARRYTFDLNRRGGMPWNMPYGTYKATHTTGSSRLDFNVIASRELIREDTFNPATKSNIKMSDYRGSFLPYFGVIKLGTSGSSVGSTTTYALGRGKYWFQVSLIGGGGGGGGGDNFNGAVGGSGGQMDACFYVASDSVNQAIRVFVGGGGEGGYGNNVGDAGKADSYRALGGTGYATGGKGGTMGGVGKSGNGGGGGGSSAIVWYPNGTGSTGYLLVQAGGGGGGGGGGRYGPIGLLTAGQRILYGTNYGLPYLAGGYSVVPFYAKQSTNDGLGVWPGAFGGGNQDTSYSVNAPLTNDAAIAATKGYDAPGGQTFYTELYKPYFETPARAGTAGYSPYLYQIFEVATMQGGHTDYTGTFNMFSTDAQRNAIFASLIDGGGGGGGGGGYGNPGFHPPFGIKLGEGYDSDNVAYYNGTVLLESIAYDFGGTGGATGYSYIRNTLVSTTFEYNWRNIGPRALFSAGAPTTNNNTDGGAHVPNLEGVGPIDRSTRGINDALFGVGGAAGTGGEGVSGQRGGSGKAGAALIMLTTADHEGGMFNPNLLFSS